jgi:hypothetical protein
MDDIISVLSPFFVICQLLSDTLRDPIPEARSLKRAFGEAFSWAGKPENDKSVQCIKGDDCKMNG